MKLLILGVFAIFTNIANAYEYSNDTMLICGPKPKQMCLFVVERCFKYEYSRTDIEIDEDAIFEQCAWEAERLRLLSDDK